MRFYLGVLFLTMASFVATSAPAPKKKPVITLDRPKKIIGAWTMEWNGTDAETSFAPDKTFYCHWMGRPWVGSWEFKDGVLTVRETCDPGPDAVFITWSVTFSDKSSWKGKMGGYGTFDLKPTKRKYD